MKFATLACATLLSLSTLPAHAADPAPLRKVDGVMADSRGMTVYTFDKDAGGKSACTGRCAQNWPPVPAGSAQLSAPYASITREDGTQQLTYNGKPLYNFVKDKQAGDKSGDKLMNNAWHALTE